MRDASYWINQLQLLPHPEGGFYKETYRSPAMVTPEALPSVFSGARNFSTAIYFLLQSSDISAFHKIHSDELWHFHEGSTILIYTLSKQKGLEVMRLGLDVASGDQPQVVVPAGTWFGATVEKENSYGLSSCTVSPGFDFDDFEMAKRDHLLKEFPLHEKIIVRLTASPH